MKLNWGNLTKDERAEYMRLQMSPSYSGMRSGSLPDDCSECGACGQPCFGSVGWCQSCLHRKIELDNKLRGKEDKGVLKPDEGIRKGHCNNGSVYGETIY